MNQWPGLQLRVTEAWDEDNYHTRNSLHYEGRAVDITTSDRDRKKYGLLGRLAVEAGFDWVYYESRSHIHASCKSEATSPSKNGGCFTGESTVMTSSGARKEMKDVEIGDEILTVNSAGDFEFSPVLLFLDRDPEETRKFVEITTETGAKLTLTPTHLVYHSEFEAENSIEEDVSSEFAAVYAEDVLVGDRVLVQSGGRLRPERVVSRAVVASSGVFAPLTSTGTLVVDSVVASCYAVVDSQFTAHAAFAPVRLYESAKRGLSKLFFEDGEVEAQNGVHWYADVLYSMARVFLPNHLR